VRLFSQVFSQSEGQAEGALIASLAANLFESCPDGDLYNVVAEDGSQLVGSAFLTRLRFEHSYAVFMLSPVAVQSAFQGRGIGQALIEFGLTELRRVGVQFVLTYGDPAFYSKVGFRPISDEAVRPPFPLSQPEGWLGLSLGSNPIEGLSGTCSCVSAFCDAAYW
jgi:predicted N-acetyltransferase YhbS